jgi:BASS family bile acid:Na+ symporter
MKKIYRLLKDRNVILFIALGVGLALPEAAPLAYHLILPALALVMTLSVMGVPGSTFRTPRSLVAPGILGIVMNYVVLAGFILAASAILVHDEEVWKGFIILAGVPPAVAVIPFSEFLKGDKTYSLIGTVGAYLGALVIMPLIAFALLGEGFFDPGKLLIIMAELILAPLLLSRLLLHMGLEERLEPWKGTITNWSFFVVVYTTVGLNREVFLHRPLTLLPVMAVAAGSTFFLAWVIESIGKALKTDPRKVTSAVLLGTLKNYGLAGGMALALFGVQTAIPATVSTVFMIVYVIYLGLKKH